MLNQQERWKYSIPQHNRTGVLQQCEQVAFTICNENRIYCSDPIGPPDDSCGHPYNFRQHEYPLKERE